jgi:type II secretory pathway pseudopilin PulG
VLSRDTHNQDPFLWKSHSRQVGLTLIELLGVLVILSLVATTGTVSLRHIAGKARVRHTVDRLQWLHESTRKLAVSTKEEWFLEFDTDRGLCRRRRQGDDDATLVGSELQLHNILHVNKRERSSSPTIRYLPFGESDWCFAEITDGQGILLSGSTSQTLYPVVTNDAKSILREAQR